MCNEISQEGDVHYDHVDESDFSNITKVFLEGTNFNIKREKIRNQIWLNWVRVEDNQQVINKSKPYSYKKVLCGKHENYELIFESL